MTEFEEEFEEEYESAMSDSDTETVAETHHDGMIAYIHVIVEQCLTCCLQIQ